MPRPKRTKITSAATRVAKPAPRTQQAAATTARRAKPSNTITSFSEDSDGLVTKATTTRPARRLPARKGIEVADEADLIMTGALPMAEDVPIPSTKNRTPASNASKTRAVRSTRTSAATSTRSPAAEAEEAPEGESSGFGDLTLSSFGSVSPAHGTRPPSAIKMGATPGHEASILALTNFKRRARQPSLLRMVQQTTDAEDNDQSGLDDTDNFDFDDFMPETESTPLNVRKSAPENENRNDSGMNVSSSGSRGVKRKLSPVVQVPRSSPPYDPPSGADVESVRSTSPSLPEVLPSREEVVEQTQDAEPLSETYAPPMSSSPLREMSRPARTPAPARPRGRGRPRKNAPQHGESDAEETETETPAKARRNTKSKSKAKTGISTAQLKGLLPRRRNQHLRDRDEFDMDSSSAAPMDSDQDELQMPLHRSRQATKKSGRGKKGVKASVKAKARPSKTYSRRVSSDKENDLAVEEVTEASMLEHSEKLAAIRRKFEEVDRFELEFEEVSGVTSSSPFG